MHVDTGIIRVITANENGDRAAVIECSQSILPNPGSYLLSHNPEEQDAVLGIPIFPFGYPGTFSYVDGPVLGPIPPSWVPGMTVNLTGPLGRGFNIPQQVRKLALAVFGDSCGYLLPLIKPAVEYGADIVLFSNLSIQSELLPPAVELHPLKALQDNLQWASFLAMDISIRNLYCLRETLKLGPHERIPCPAQVLIHIPMPCATLAECGACAVQTRKSGYKLTCKDGPVFDINELDW